MRARSLIFCLAVLLGGLFAFAPIPGPTEAYAQTTGADADKPKKKRKRKKRRRRKKKKKKKTSTPKKAPDLAPAPPPPVVRTPKKKQAPLGNVARKQERVDRSRIDPAIRLLKEGGYAQAAVTLYDLTGARALPEPLRLEARYNLAKALYRMKLHHSALHHFTEILKKGPATTFYAPSLEWCLFIARKIVADDRVLQSVARYSSGTFPEEYASEFQYLLARYHYLEALALDAAATQANRKPDKPVQEKSGLSVDADPFGDIFNENAPPSQSPDSGSSLSMDEDIFGFDEETPASPKSPAGKAKADGFTSAEHIAASNRLVTRVSSTSPFAARAKFLEAVLQFKAGKGNAALNDFKSVVRMTKEGAPHEDPDLRQLAFFQLARTHFGAEQPTHARWYYDKMERFTEEWLEAMYESSWAEFRLGNYEKALGNLLTLHSPFFAEEYFPESHILKAVAYYENCRYPEALKILDRFQKRYEPVLAELNKLTGESKTSEQYYEILLNRQHESLDDLRDRATIMSQILLIALTDPEVQKLDASYREVNTELATLERTGSVFGGSAVKAELVSVISKVRSKLAKKAGAAVRRTLSFERHHIRELVEQSVRIEVETASAEQKRIEATLIDVDSRPKEIDKEFVEWTDDEKIVWPFDEEYWRDELGTYELTLAQSCVGDHRAPAEDGRE